MSESQIRTMEQVRRVLAGTQALEFVQAQGDQGCYAWIEAHAWQLTFQVPSTMIVELTIGPGV